MGIFASSSNLFVRYRAELQFRDKLMGGIPQNPEVVEGWIRSKSGVSAEEEIQNLVRRTMVEQGTWKADMTSAEIEQASKLVAGLKETSGFKRDAEGGLFVESRQIKAALKEAVNILYPGEVWGATTRRNAKGEDVTGYRGKGPKSYLAERVFVSPDHIHLDRMEPDGVELVIGHIIGPQGPRSTLGYHEYVTNATIQFDVLVVRDAIKAEYWPELWSLMEENGIGALRSQDYGRFDIIRWDRVDTLGRLPA